VVPAYRIRERLFGFDIDKHANEVVKAFSYAAQTSNGIVKDGSSLSSIQASSISSPCVTPLFFTKNFLPQNPDLPCRSTATLSTTQPMSSPSVCLSGTSLSPFRIPESLNPHTLFAAGGKNQSASARMNDSLLQRFHSVTLDSTVVWDAQSTKINEQKHFDDVASRKYYVGMLQIGTAVKV
jgi:hypothetical protein